MDIELRKILDEVYANRMKPDEAQWKICVLFNVSNNEVSVCECLEEWRTQEDDNLYCSKCGAKWD